MSRGGRRLSSQFDRIIQRAGTEKADLRRRKVTAHSLRHNHATRIAAGVGHNPLALKDLTGHARRATTQIHRYRRTATATVIEVADLPGASARVPQRKEPAEAGS